MGKVGVFSEAGWDTTYRIRAAVNTGDARLFGDLSVALTPEVAVQVTVIGETLLRQVLGNDPALHVLNGAGAVLVPHLQHFLGSSDITQAHAVELIRTGLRLQDCPAWASRAQVMMFFCAFLAPVDDAEFLDFRIRLEPLWASAIEGHER